MIYISRYTDYALRVVLDLAAMKPGAGARIREIAARQHVPSAVARRVVARLVSAGVVASTRGIRGGVRLAKPAGAISVWDVVTIFEGNAALNRCVEDPRVCPLTPTCAAHRVWVATRRRLRTWLRAVRFDTLARSSRLPRTRGARGRLHGRGDKR
jgi:Rrf2 family protein